MGLLYPSYSWGDGFIAKLDLDTAEISTRIVLLADFRARLMRVAAKEVLSLRDNELRAIHIAIEEIGKQRAIMGRCFINAFKEVASHIPAGSNLELDALRVDLLFVQVSGLTKVNPKAIWTEKKIEKVRKFVERVEKEATLPISAPPKPPTNPE